jgi:hypothetical protein
MALIACPVFEVFFGGSRGGGKSDGMLGDWIAHADRYGEHAIGLMVRRERTQLIEMIERSRSIYSLLGAKFLEQEKMWRFPNGARLRFAYLERDADADSYQGHSYSRVYVEEIGTFPSAAPVLKLMATLRSGAGVQCGFRATGNPGGPGHQWVKARYIDPAPAGWKILTDSYKNPWTGELVKRERVYIPSRLNENRYLGSDYVANLQMQGSPTLVRAWLEGDWSVIEGAFFPEWSMDKHVIAPFSIPDDWLRFRSADWGSAAPFSIGWWAVVGDDVLGGRDGSHLRRATVGDDNETSVGRNDSYIPHYLPRGALVRYREWYGASAPNTGLKLPAEDVAEGIKAREIHEPRKDGGDKPNIAYGVLDPSAFASDGGPSIAERMATRGVMFRRADNTRVSQRGAMGGWDQLRSRLIGDGERPMIYFFSTCKDAIRTLPALQHDQARAEDVDSDGEDHAADEIRYACMSRPYVRRIVAPQPRKDELIYEAQADGRIVANMGIREIVEMKRRKRERDA